MRVLEITEEGSTGILTLNENSESREFIPFYDLDAARGLLLEFQELRDVNGNRLKDNYIVKGRDWFPSAVSWLYWHIFYTYIKYQKLLDPVLRKETKVARCCPGELHSFFAFLENKEAAPRWKLEILHALIALHNQRALRNHPHPLMFYRFNRDDFRSVEIRKSLKEVAGEFLEALPCPNFRSILKSLRENEAVYYYASPPASRKFRHSYPLSSLSLEKRILFQAAIHYVEKILSAYLREHNRHNKWLHGSNVRTFYGFDDVNGYCMPLLLACKDRKIRCVAHQHGAYVKRHAGYIMEGIDPRRYEWFDRLIVWGPYWRDKLLRDSRVHGGHEIVAGANKFSWDYSHGGSVVPGRKNILVPYEFLTNTHAVGKFISAFVKSGYTVYFKPRADEDPEKQLEAYKLDQETHQAIRIIHQLTPQFMGEIDIIAATMTTLVYELLPYGKIIWILDCEYRHLMDLVEEGYAHHLLLADLPMPLSSKWVPCKIETEYLFTRETLKETLCKNVLDQNPVINGCSEK